MLNIRDQRHLVRVATALLAVSILLVERLAPLAELFAQGSSNQTRTKELPARVEHLIEQLDSNKRVVRVRGERDLLGLGPGILPLLPSPERYSSASVREALRRIRVRLEREKARKSVQPSRVTLNGTFSVEHILSQLSKQTANSIDFDDVRQIARDRWVAVDWNQKPFWQALDQLLTQADIRLAVDSGATGVRLQRVPAGTGRLQPTSVAYSGGFRFVALAATIRPIFGDKRNRLLSLPFQIMAEPRLRPLFLKYSSRDITSRTGSNVALQPLNLDAKYELPLGIKGHQLRRIAAFQLPIFHQIAHVELKGKLVMLTAAGAEIVAFRDLPKSTGVSRRQGGVVVELTKVTFRKTENSEYSARIRVAVTYDTGGPAFESHRTWMYHNDVYLETDVGRRVDVNDGFETKLQLDGAVAVEYRFKHLTEKPNGYKFVYVAPTLLIDVPIEFRFPRIDVPHLNAKKE